mgnify:CR=1 FL=1
MQLEELAFIITFLSLHLQHFVNFHYISNFAIRLIAPYAKPFINLFIFVCMCVTVSHVMSVRT